MPVPSSDFTKSKWLAFFAELTSKITHHNVAVVREGVELLRRLLLTRVGVGAILEEASLLQHLCDTIHGYTAAAEQPGIISSTCLLSSKASTFHSDDAEVVECLFQGLHLIVISAISIFTGNDEYLSLLVMARVGLIIESLGKVVAASHHRHPVIGRACAIVQALLTGLPCSPGAYSPSAKSSFPNVSRHLLRLKEKVAEIPEILDRFGDLIQLAASYHTDSSPYVLVFAKLLEHVRIAKMKEEKTTKGSAAHTITAQMIAGSFEKIINAQKHLDVFIAFDELWCCLTVDADTTCSLLTNEQLATLDPYVSIEPTTADDTALFFKVLSWFGALLSSVAHVSDTVAAFCSSHVVRGLVTILAAHLAHNPVQDSTRSTASTSSFPSSILSSSTSHPMHLYSASGMIHRDTIVAKPTTALSILAFLQTIHSAVPFSTDDLLLWLKSILPLLGQCIQLCTEISSKLIDAPSEIDGTLPDELYLMCALQQSRDHSPAVGCLAGRFLAEILNAHRHLFVEHLHVETTSLCQALIPCCVQIVCNNPTMMVQDPSNDKPLSVIHQGPTCPRSTRPCCLGESTSAALDAMMAYCRSADVTVLDAHSLARFVDALDRITRKSVAPQLRTTVPRLLIHGTSHFSHFLAINGEVPGLTFAMAEKLMSIRANTKEVTASQWDISAAALWLSQVVILCMSEPKVDCIDIIHAGLPQQLLQIATMTPISYGAAALLHLLNTIAEAQHRQQTMAGSQGGNQNKQSYQLVHFDGSTSVLVPQGKTSIANWIYMLSEQLTSLRAMAIDDFKAAGPASDRKFRALSAAEELKAKLWYVANLFRAVATLCGSEYCDYFPQESLVNTVAALFKLPLPSEMLSRIAKAHVVSVHNTSELLILHSSAISSASQLLLDFFDSRHAKLFHELPLEFFEGASRIMAATELRMESRLSVVRVLNQLLRLAAHKSIRHSFENVSKLLFSSAAKLPLQHESTVCLISKLVNCFRDANHAAAQDGLVTNIVERLKIIAASILVSKSLTPAESHEYAASMSLITSYVAYFNAYPLSKNDAQNLAAFFGVFLSSPLTRFHCLNALKYIVLSEEGRSLLLLDSYNNHAHHHSKSDPRNKENDHHSMIGGRNNFSIMSSSRASYNKLNTDSTTSLKGHNNCFSMLVHLTFFGAVTAEEASLGSDAIGIACSRGGDAFALPLVRLRVLDCVTAMLIEFDRKRLPPPVAPFRLLASVSTCTDIQLIIARDSNLMNLLIDAAVGESTRFGRDLDPASRTLALMTLRSLAFHSSLKNNLSLDRRYTQLLIDVFWQREQQQQPSWSSTNKSIHEVKSAPGSRSDSSHDIIQPFLRRELAGTALWALAHHNQRSKGYLKGAMAACGVTVAEAERQIKLSGELSALPTYHERMKEILDGIRAVGLDQTASSLLTQ